jgi:hypothetical protein
MDTIIVATFNERSKAGPIKQQLEESHIPAEIHDESTMEKFWFVGKPLAGVHVKVPARDYERACQIIHEENRDLLRDAVCCPECSSSRIEYPQYARKSVLPNIFGGIAAGLGLIEKEFYCLDCHYTWPREGHKPSKAKPHMAPYYFIEGVPQKEPTASGNR